MAKDPAFEIPAWCPMVRRPPAPGRAARPPSCGRRRRELVSAAWPLMPVRKFTRAAVAAPAHAPRAGPGSGPCGEGLAAGGACADVRPGEKDWVARMAGWAARSDVREGPAPPSPEGEGSNPVRLRLETSMSSELAL